MRLVFFLSLTLSLSLSLTLLQVITIFSASNYYEIGSNKGAYLKLNPQLIPHFVQYTAAASKTKKLTFRQRIGLVECSALRELGARLRERRNELEREFKARDPDATGKNPCSPRSSLSPSAFPLLPKSGPGKNRNLCFCFSLLCTFCCTLCTAKSRFTNAGSLNCRYC